MLADRALRVESNARRAASWGAKNPAATDWMRRDARELTWQERTRREWDSIPPSEQWHGLRYGVSVAARGGVEALA